MAKPWTPEEDQQLRDLADRGWVTSRIARAIGRSHKSVQWRIGRLGLAGNRRVVDGHWLP